MPHKQNPFSLYDFLGYLLPGAALILIILIILDQSDSSHPIKIIKEQKDTYLIPSALIASYILGHILGIASSITIEPSYLRREGYPSRSILGLKNQDEKAKTSWTRPFDKFFDLHSLAAKNFVRLLESSKKEETLAPALAHKIKEKIQIFLKDEYDHYEKDSLSKGYFHTIYHYCVENTPNHLPKIQNYVALYGLMRNTALVALISLWATIISSIKNVALALLNNQEIVLSPQKTIIAALSLSAFIILYRGFTKFYKRYSLEVIMAFSTSYKPEKKQYHSFKKKLTN
ncbi:hypothetical protein RTE98_12435 [Stutzerimonas frequens]|uniref:hypothetical protein n=1 Tax=Stutzerimonas frequens TaxID=2968969 RepID=UPI0029342267|nr:hypothetical protein [Stutzerimonas frequens]WOC77274.1 hypothetical protein RTE98_12435 [Stutzerimonas frequens]